MSFDRGKEKDVQMTASISIWRTFLTKSMSSSLPSLSSKTLPSSSIKGNTHYFTKHFTQHFIQHFTQHSTQHFSILLNITQHYLIKLSNFTATRRASSCSRSVSMRGASPHSLIPLISLARSTPRSRGCWITASTSQSLNLPSRRQRTSIRIMTLMSCMTWSRCITPPTEKKELREYN